MEAIVKYLSVFSGIEAASVAWHPIGWEPLGFSEIDPFASAVLAHRFPGVRNYGDITRFEDWGLVRGSVDVLVGGSPCQSFSVAGLRRGLEDARGQLTLTYLGLAASLRPRWLVWENVPGVLSADGGRAFGSFLGGLAELGYGFAWRVLDARYFGVPQRRRRVFLVARDSGDWRSAGTVLLEPSGLRGDLATGAATGQIAAANAPDCARNRGPWWDGTDCASTLTRKGAEQRMPDKGNFFGVFTEGALGQLVESNVSGTLRAQGESAKGASTLTVYSPRGHYRYRPSDHSSTLQNREDRMGGHSHVITIDMQACKSNVNVGEDISPTLCRPSGTDVHAVVFRKGRMATSDSDHETWVEATESNTINCFDVGDIRTTHAIAFNWQNGGGYGNANEGLGITEGATGPLQRCQTPAVATSMVVRRLTPVECERLQGFPDGWTDIPYRGKAAPDGPRYKALGNSMAVPCMAWIGRRIQTLEDGLL